MVIKGQGDLLIAKSICMSVECVLGTQGEPRNEAMPMAYLHFCTICQCDKEQQ